MVGQAQQWSVLATASRNDSFSLRRIPAIEVSQQCDDIDHCGFQRLGGVRWRHGQVPTRSGRAIIATETECIRRGIHSFVAGRSIIARPAGQYFVPVGSADRDHSLHRRTSGSRDRHACELFSRPLDRQFLWLPCWRYNVTGRRWRSDGSWTDHTGDKYYPRIAAHLYSLQFIAVLMIRFYSSLSYRPGPRHTSHTSS